MTGLVTYSAVPSRFVHYMWLLGTSSHVTSSGILKVTNCGRNRAVTLMSSLPTATQFNFAVKTVVNAWTDYILAMNVHIYSRYIGGT